MKYPRGAAGSDLALFIVFIIGLGIIWVATGGPERPISRSGPFLGSPFSGETGDIPTVGERISAPAEDGSVDDILARINESLLGLQSGEEKSPYAEYVSLSISTAKQENAQDEYLTIKTSRSLTGTLTISDWRVESTVSGNSVPLGFAAQLPRSGQINNQNPVALGSNATVYLVSGRSPIGASFRVNSCTGYFAQFQTFEPRLPIECPYPTQELQAAAKRIPDYRPSPGCYNYIGTINQCHTVTGSIPPDVDGTCQGIIRNDLSYNGCVNLHQGDVDFYKNEWRLYFGKDTELWKKKDERIRLLDEAGRVIDVVSY